MSLLFGAIGILAVFRESGGDPHSCPNDIVGEDFATENNCQLRLALVERMPFVGTDSGLYVKLFGEIEKASGIKMIRNYGEWTANLSSGETDVVLGHTFVDDTPNVDFGPLFYVDVVMLVVPKPRDQFIRRNLSKVFSLQLFSLFLVAHATTAIFHVQVTKSSRRTPLLVFFYCYCLYRIVVEAAYVGKLASIFGTPSKEVKITNEELLYVNEYDVYASLFFWRVAKGLFRFTNDDWLRRHVHFSNWSDLDVIRYVSAPENHATAQMLKSTLDMYASDVAAVDTFANTKLRNFRLFCTFHLRKGNVLNAIVKYWAQEIIERGLVMKWLDDVALANRNLTIEKRSNETPETFVAFTLEYYEEVYALLFAGYAASSFVFVLEFAWRALEAKIARVRESAPF